MVTYIVKAWGSILIAAGAMGLVLSISNLAADNGNQSSPGVVVGCLIALAVGGAMVWRTWGRD